MNRGRTVRILIDYLKKEKYRLCITCRSGRLYREKKTSKKSYECPLAGRGRSGVYQDPG